MIDVSTTHNQVALDNVVKIAFKHQKSTDDMIAAVQAAKTEGHDYKDMQRSFYAGEIAGHLHPTAPKVTPSMIEEANHILDLKNHTEKHDGDTEYRTKEQQRICNTLRKAWQRIAFAAGLDTIDNRGSTGPNVANPETPGREHAKKIANLRRYSPPIAESVDEVIEFTLDLATLVEKFVQQNSKMIPPELRPILANFIRDMGFVAHAPADQTKAA